MHAIIVLGHGSRSAEATAQFLEVVGYLRERGVAATVLPAFMELAEPGLPAAFAEAVAGGATRVTVLSCFLFQGNHIKRDVPEMLAQLKTRYPHIAIRFSRPIGPDPRIADILQSRVEEAADV